MLGARKAGEKRHIRAVLNQFLMEWDGLMSRTNPPFLLLATNRPSNHSPAVLRRAPVQIFLDLPMLTEREGILELLLRDEVLDGLTYRILTTHTHKYSGSDLKNMCVQAATLAVSELRRNSEHRVLRRDHFLKAMELVRATPISAVVKKEYQKFQRSEGQGNNHEEE